MRATTSFRSGRAGDSESGHGFNFVPARKESGSLCFRSDQSEFRSRFGRGKPHTERLFRLRAFNNRGKKVLLPRPTNPISSRTRRRKSWVVNAATLPGAIRRSRKINSNKKGLESGGPLPGASGQRSETGSVWRDARAVSSGTRARATRALSSVIERLNEARQEHYRRRPPPRRRRRPSARVLIDAREFNFGAPEEPSGRSIRLRKQASFVVRLSLPPPCALLSAGRVDFDFA